MREIIINDIVFRVCVNHYKDIAVSECGMLYSVSKQCIIEPSNWGKIKYHTTSARHINGRILPVPFHRAVALYWVDNPLNKTHVNHINHNKHDNRACNLEWVTHEENMNAYRIHNQNQFRIHNMKLKKDIIKNIFLNGSGFETPKKVADKTGFSYSYVRKIFNENLGRGF